MRILFGVQGTGNGHISRSKEIIKYLVEKANVDVLVSGSQHEVDLGVDVKYKHTGLGFTFGKNGGIDYIDSFAKAKPLQLIKDLRSIPVKEYDLVLSDFEPLTAWASRINNIPSIGISHQAAFLSKASPRIPNPNLFQELIIKWYAPTNMAIGLHFKKYDDTIELPIIREEIREAEPSNNGHYTVYLPSYHEDYMCSLLNQVDVKWEMFSKHYNGEPYEKNNVKVYPISNQDFVRSMASAEGVLCNSGFETPSETLYLGKKLFVIPMKRQYEQQCNAQALKEMGIAVAEKITSDFVAELTKWTESSTAYKPGYDNNSPEIVERVFRMYNEHMNNKN